MNVRLAVAGLITCVAMMPNTCRAQSTGATIDVTSKTIVKLFGAGIGNLDSYGSGVVVSAEGHVVTVWNHLVNNAFLTAVVADGRRFNVEVVGTSLDHDLAVLKLDSNEDELFAFVDPARQADVALGQSVLAFSNVFHVATGSEPVSVVHGIVACESQLEAGLGRWDFPVKTPVYILDAITNNSGAAGGLLTDLQGNPLGLLGREIRHRGTSMWVNYAVPWRTLKPAVTAIIAGERVEKTDAEEDDRRLSERQLTAAYGLTLMPGVLEKTPAYIDRIIPNSIADSAGLRRGDLVVLVNDDVVQSVQDMQRFLARLRRRQKITITVSRRNSLQTVSLRTPR